MVSVNTILGFVLTFLGDLWGAMSGPAQSILQAYGDLFQHYVGWIFGQA